MAPITHERGGCVLVVDEEVRTIQRLSAVLKTSPYVLARCLAVDDVRRHADDSGVCAIVSDASLRRGNAVNLLSTLRKHSPDIPFILLSSGADPHAIPEWIRVGAFQHLTQPILPDRVLDVVTQAVRSHRVLRFQRRALALGAGDVRQAEWEARNQLFERALGRVRLVYQPIVQARNGKLLGYEGMPCSDDPELGTPEALVQAAAQLGAVTRLGQTIRSLAAEALETDPNCLLFIRIEPIELVDPDLHDYRARLAKHAHRVVLQLSERAALQDLGCARSMVASLRDRGFRVASDHFGVGCFGPFNVALLQPEFIKLDRALIGGLHESVDQQQLVGAIAAHFRAMGVSVVAQGIETSWERRLVTELGCDLLQGRFISPVRQSAQSAVAR